MKTRRFTSQLLLLADSPPAIMADKVVPRRYLIEKPQASPVGPPQTGYIFCCLESCCAPSHSRCAERRCIVKSHFRIKAFALSPRSNSGEAVNDSSIDRDTISYQTTSLIHLLLRSLHNEAHHSDEVRRTVR